jgi:hypothetical protein
MADIRIHRQGGQQPIRPAPTNPGPVDFGPNVIIFDPKVTTIQAQTQSILNTQKSNQFGTARYAFFFKKGVYNNLTLEIGYYTTVHGLGASPDDVTINGGGVQSLGQGGDGTALENFWRGVENLSIVPLIAPLGANPRNLNIWAVSQATYMRRVHIKGGLILSDPFFDFTNQNFSSGGFIADSVVDSQTISRTQQQFLTRNTDVGAFPDGVWNMVFVGDLHAPAEEVWGTHKSGQAPYTVIGQTPVIREKPYLTFGSDGTYSVVVPALATNTQGPTWTGSPPPAASIPINNFYIAKPAPGNGDNAPNLNQKLQEGFHVILTPGVYPLASSLQVNHPGTCILGLGIATLVPTNNNAAMHIADVAGVSVSGILFDAGLASSPSLLVVGPQGSNTDHTANPTALFDISCRVGGATPTAAAVNCITINSHNVILDNVWIWRADHALNNNPLWTGFDVNPSDNGITVNGDNVTAYGLFVEHFKKYQTQWNGNNGSTYFYQSEAPYDVPSQNLWKQPSGENGFPSYKVGSNVQTHTAKGLGVYCNFTLAPIQLENAISTPSVPGVNMHHMVTVWLNGNVGSSINHIINEQGAKVTGTQPGIASFLS